MRWGATLKIACDKLIFCPISLVIDVSLPTKLFIAKFCTNALLIILSLSVSEVAVIV